MSTIFIFRRDLRLNDNVGLIQCIKQPILPIFILTPEQLIKNKYKSNNAVQFMMESIIDLNKQLKNKGSRLRLFYGKPSKVLNKLLNKLETVNTVIANMDYTPYARNRDKELKNVCKDYNVEFILAEDYLLNPVASILTESKEIYTKFTPYWRKARKVRIDKPQNISKKYLSARKRINGEFNINNLDKFYKFNPKLLHRGGRINGLKQLKLSKNQKRYNKTRNCLDQKTTELSAHIKFGTVSIREVYWYFKTKLRTSSKDLLKQLYWRDFYSNIVWGYPRVLQGKSLKPNYDQIRWWSGQKANKYFKLWCKGQTGFPIVDAGMRQMNTTGFMHNRARMIVASFLVKTLLIDWRLGERYFAQTLYDYDPSNNNGGWQFISSSGADSQPYFRIFNPWLQAKRFDPDCIYIKHWVPELRKVPNKDIHKWYNVFDEYSNYLEPIVDYSLRRKKAIKMYKKL